MSYFDVALKPAKLAKIAKLSSQISDLLGIKNHFVIGRGVSGVLALPHYAKAFKCEMAISRKNCDSSHSGKNKIEFAHGKSDNFLDSKVCIVDDFTETGSTLLAIKNHIDRYGGVTSIVFLYYPDYWCNIIGGTEEFDKAFRGVPIIGINMDDKKIFTENLKPDQKNKVIEFATSVGYTVRGNGDVLIKPTP